MCKDIYIYIHICIQIDSKSTPEQRNKHSLKQIIKDASRISEINQKYVGLSGRARTRL